MYIVIVIIKQFCQTDKYLCIVNNKKYLLFNEKFP